VASAESSDDFIYIISLPTTKKILLVIFTRIKKSIVFLSPCDFHKKKNMFLNFSNRRYFSGIKETTCMIPKIIPITFKLTNKNCYILCNSVIQKSVSPILKCGEL